MCVFCPMLNVMCIIMFFFFLWLLKLFLSPITQQQAAPKNTSCSVRLLPTCYAHVGSQSAEHFLYFVPSQTYTNNKFTNYFSLLYFWTELKNWKQNSNYLKQLIITMPIRWTGWRIPRSKITKPKRERRFLTVITVTAD